MEAEGFRRDQIAAATELTDLLFDKTRSTIKCPKITLRCQSELYMRLFSKTIHFLPKAVAPAVLLFRLSLESMMSRIHLYNSSNLDKPFNCRRTTVVFWIFLKIYKLTVLIAISSRNVAFCLRPNVDGTVFQPIKGEDESSRRTGKGSRVPRRELTVKSIGRGVDESGMSLSPTTTTGH